MILFSRPRPKAEACPKGFTLVELSVAMLLASLAVGAAYGVFVFTSRWTAEWQDAAAARRAAHLITQRLTADLLSAEQVDIFDEELRLIRSRPGDTVTYRHEAGRLARNGLVMHSPEVAATFVATPSRRETRYAQPGAATDTLGVRVAVMVRAGAHDVLLETVVQPRRRRPWAPLDVSEQDVGG